MKIIKKYFYHPIKNIVAKYYLILLQKYCKLIVIGITGSSGKTTTKEMLFSILSQKNNVICSKDNIDPVFNIASSILKCSPKTKYLILELGVEYKNEMNFYMSLVKPDIGVITNIYDTHTKYFTNKKGVYMEKSKIIKFTKKAFFTLENVNYFSNLKNLANTQKIKFIKVKIPNKVFFTKQFTTKFDKYEIPVLGEVFANNAQIAITVSTFLNISETDIKNGLKSFQMQKNRMKILKINKAIVIDDSYNNNPEAAKTSIKTLIKIAKDLNLHNKFIIFGSMKDLGKISDEKHLEIKTLINKNKIKALTIGEETKVMNLNYYKNFENLKKEFKKLTHQKCVILIKGSRSIGLDKLISQTHF